MKPRFRSLFTSSLPALIIVPGLASGAYGQGNTILPNPAGDVIVAGNHDELKGADWTVLANGGTQKPFDVTVEQGAFLTGASHIGSAVEASVAGYTITNAGILDAWQFGVDSTGADTVIHNLAGAVIRGGSIGIRFREVSDPETTRSFTASVPEPVALPEVNNDGEISGNSAGVFTDNGLTLNNRLDGIIRSSFGNGITVGNGLNLDNKGLITGGLYDGDDKRKTLHSLPVYETAGSGVVAGAEAMVTNGGTIAGKGGDGVFCGDGLTLSNSGSISGEGRPQKEFSIRDISLNPVNGDGVRTGDDADVSNKSGGSIMGADDGIDAGRKLTLNNSGTITGSGDAGVDTLDGATITNKGTIHGNQYGVIFNSSRPAPDSDTPLNAELVTSVLPLTSPAITPVIPAPSSIDNSGTISGTVAAISATDGFTLHNRAAGVVTASNGTALIAGSGLTLNNHGSITGIGGDGVQAGDETSIVNGGSIASNPAELPAVSDSTLSTPPTTNGVAVRAGDDAVIANLASGSISGISHGIIAGNRLELGNAGTITASHEGHGDTAVLAQGTATITNSGQINGDHTGIRIDEIVMEGIAKAAASGGTPSLSSIDNTGTISGGAIGVSAGANLTISNGKDALVEAITGNAIRAGNQLTLTNRGRIQGGSSGDAILAGTTLKLRNQGSVRSGMGSNAITSGNDAVITNLASAAIQGGLHAITTGDSLVLENSGNILASGTAIRAGSGAKVTNDGTIDGDDWAIVLDDSPALIANARKSMDPAVSETPPIETALPSSIVNQGTIQSGGTAISAGDELSVKNSKDAFVAAGSGIGVNAGDLVTIENAGTITSSGVAAIFTGEALKLENSGTINANGEQPPSDAKPTTFGTGIFTGDDARITNREGAKIAGKQNGIAAGQFLTLENSGEISASTTAVHAGFGLELANNGMIVGETNGVVIEPEPVKPMAIREQEVPFAEIIPVLPPVILIPRIITNYGTIQGTAGIGVSGSSSSEYVINHNLIGGGNAAISLGGGDDVIALNLGSDIQGNIDGGEGVDVLNFFDGLESPGDRGNIVHGDVTGMEYIAKQGTGFAFIGDVGESVKVEADMIEVRSGGLVINGNLSSQDGGKTRIKLEGGQLEGTGEWNADLEVVDGGISAGYTVNRFVDGVRPLAALTDGVEPVYSIGTFTIHGDVTHHPVAKDSRASLAAPAAVIQPTYIRQDITPQTPIIDGVNSDTIVQNGVGNSYDVTGVDVRIAPTDINKTLTDGTYTVIDSDSALMGSKQLGKLGVHFGSNAVESGRFKATQSGVNNHGTVLANHFAKLTTTDPVGGAGSDSNLIIEIDHNYAGLPGLNEGEAAFGAALDAAVGSDNPIVQDFIAALDYSDLGTVQSTLSALDPGTTLELVSSVVDSNYRLHRLTQNHLASIRGQGSATETAQPTYDDKGAMVPGETGSITGGLGNAWGSLSYDGQDYDAGGTRSDFDGDSGSFTAGVDWHINDKLVLGLVLDGTRSDQDGIGFSSDIDSLRVAVYGTWGEETGFYSDFLAGYGDHRIESTRNLGALLGGISHVESDASSLQALLTAGYTMTYLNLKHGPFAGLEYQNVDVDGFSQGGFLPLTVGNHEVDSLRAMIGYRVDAEYGKFRPYASVAYAHEFEDGSHTAPATFAGVPFSVSGEEQSSALLVTAGTGIALTSSLTLDIGYRGDIATDDGLISHGGSIGLNFAF